MSSGCFCWNDFLRCVTASIIYFIVSIMAVSRYVDGSSKAAGIFGFIATIAFALDFYLIFNELATFLKDGGQTEAEPSRQRGNATNQRVQRDGGVSRNIDGCDISMSHRRPLSVLIGQSRLIT
uniref:CKLF-like MARVEL transmembrane domain containing 3 n=1 Tax=Takifugu rubripes TaxID=31033 RepID=A0A674MDT2_TAKRU